MSVEEDKDLYGKPSTKALYEYNNNGLEIVEYKSTIKRSIHRFTWQKLSLWLTPKYLHYSLHLWCSPHMHLVDYLNTQWDMNVSWTQGMRITKNWESWYTTKANDLLSPKFASQKNLYGMIFIHKEENPSKYNTKFSKK